MRPSTAIPSLLALMLGCATAWADPGEEPTAPAEADTVETPAAPQDYDYQNDLPRVALSFVAAEGKELNPSTGEKGWETQNAVHIKRSADGETVYSIHPSDTGALKTVFIADHSKVASGGKIVKVAKLSLGTRTSKPGYMVDLGRSLFGLDNPWCATVVGDFEVSVVRSKDDERPVARDGEGCTDLFTP